MNLSRLVLSFVLAGVLLYILFPAIYCLPLLFIYSKPLPQSVVDSIVVFTSPLEPFYDRIRIYRQFHLWQWDLFFR
ncbi:MAG TPA: hypothetical protein PKO06_11435 [Candidatus Ozemobacteraceae bacterium]|nr:hypothetical protein [Candidatus Ozemobacteraceae bacterium]